MLVCVFSGYVLSLLLATHPGVESVGHGLSLCLVSPDGAQQRLGLPGPQHYLVPPTLGFVHQVRSQSTYVTATVSAQTRNLDTRAGGGLPE